MFDAAIGADAAVPAPAAPPWVTYGADPVPWGRDDYYTEDDEIRGTVYSTDTPAFATDGRIADLRVKVVCVGVHQRFRLLLVRPHHHSAGAHGIVRATPWRDGATLPGPAPYRPALGWKVHRGERIMLETDPVHGAVVGIRPGGSGRVVVGRTAGDLLTRDRPAARPSLSEALLLQTTIVPSR